jgi:hypothetical protein
MNPIKCSECQEEVKNGQEFAALKTADGWKVAHAAHVKADSELFGQRTFVMNPARAWVMNGGADAHREAQKPVTPE